MMRQFFSLYARPSFWEGVARVMDIGGTLNEYNYSNEPRQADSRAIQSDWEAVGIDLLTVLEQFEEEFQKRISGKRPKEETK